MHAHTETFIALVIQSNLTPQLDSHTNLSPHLTRRPNGNVLAWSAAIRLVLEAGRVRVLVEVGLECE